MLIPFALIGAFLLGNSFQAIISEAFFVHSWKRGQTQIEEKRCEIIVTHTKQPQKLTVRDKSGSSKYRLTVSPVESNGVTVSLTPRSPLKCFFDQAGCVNLLQPSNYPFQDAFSPRDFVMWFNPECERLDAQSRPRCNAPPIMQKRVIQVESFYVMLQVLGFETDANNPEKMVSMKLRITFSNSFD